MDSGMVVKIRTDGVEIEISAAATGVQMLRKIEDAILQLLDEDDRG